MPYKTYTEQIFEHLTHLQANGLDVTELTVDSPDWIRCHEIGKTKGRGELTYITEAEKLSNGCLGLKTSFRGSKGFGSHKTYGLWPDEISEAIKLPHAHKEENSIIITELHEQAARKAYGFWQHSDIHGKSDYLTTKEVGCYGLRFRSSEKFGDSAIVPMFDENGKLWNRQILNADGTKIMVKDGRTPGLFHMLRLPTNGKPLGIAESYVTAATCMELSDIPLVCAFSSGNLSAVTNSLLSIFSLSPIIIFGDDDRHLPKEGKQNGGRLKAEEAQKLSEDRIIVAFPDFGDLEPSKESSDWNDLVKLKGKEVALAQIRQFL